MRLAAYAAERSNVVRALLQRMATLPEAVEIARVTGLTLGQVTRLARLLLRAIPWSAGCMPLNLVHESGVQTASLLLSVTLTVQGVSPLLWGETGNRSTCSGDVSSGLGLPATKFRSNAVPCAAAMATSCGTV